MEESRNSRGDIVRKTTSDGCPVCNFRIGYSHNASTPQGAFVLSRSATDSPKEAKYKEAFDKLKFYNDYYHPYIADNADSDGDGSVSVTITFR